MPSLRLEAPFFDAEAIEEHLARLIDAAADHVAHEHLAEDAVWAAITTALRQTLERQGYGTPPSSAR